MKCPYCHEEMELGYIKSSRLIQWGTDKELGYVGNDLNLVKQTWKGMFNGHFVESYRCSKCNKIIISLEETHI